MLYALWENHMDLPAKLNVVSGDNTVTPLVYRAGSVPALQEIKDKIPYLTVDPQGADVPFNAFEDGDKIYGIYEVYDTQTLNPLEFIKPSGLEPQTYLFSNAQKGDSYIVMQSTGYLVGEKTYGYTIIFGASL
jgi:hypothetical protein